MLNKVFNPDNFVFRGIARLFDFVVLGALWLICSLPVVTLGASSAALYYSMVKCIRRGEEAPYANFFRCFRENFRVTLPLSVLTAALWFLLLWGYNIIVTLANAQGGMMLAMYMAYAVFLVVPVGTLCYLFPLISRFTLTASGAVAAAFQLAMRRLPTTLLLVLLLTQAVNLCARYWFLFFLPLAIAPAAVALLSSFFLERIFKPLTPAQPPTQENGGEEEEPRWYLK